MSSLRLHFNPSYDFPPLRKRILDIFSGNLQGTTRIESSDYAKVFRFEVPCRGATEVFFYKEFLFRNIRDRLSVLFRKSRALRGWSGGRTILDYGLSTATPVCVGESRAWGIVNRNFLVTEAIPHALDMGRFITNKFQSYGDFQNIIEKRKFIYQCGRTIGEMHRLGIFQGDLRSGNIIIQEAQARSLIINLIDNERTRIYRKLPDRKRLKNLVQVNMMLNPEITRSDRVRFFYAYLEENPTLCRAKKIWMQKVLNKTQKRLMSKKSLV